MRLLTYLIHTLFLLYSAQLFAQDKYVLKKSNISIIDKMTESKIGKELSLRELDKIVREISQDGLFQVVYVDRVNSREVRLRAEQSNKLVTLDLEGEHQLKKDEVMKKMGLQLDQVVSRLEISQAIERLENEYKNMGYFNFEITSDLKLKEDGFHLKLDVSESQYCLIEDIHINSKNPFLDKILRRELRTQRGKNYQKNTGTEMQRRINRILLENRFLTSKISSSSAIFNDDKTRVRLSFSIANPIQFEFIFHGNETYSHFKLLRQSDVGSKFLYLSDSSTEIVENLTTFYKSRGFAQVNINFSEKSFPKKFKKVFVFKIDEGPRVKIGRVKVTGKISKDPSYYVNQFHTFLGEQDNSIYYVENDIERATDNLINYLRRKGHLQAEVTSFEVNFTRLGRAEIHIQIDEGLLTYVRQVLFRGAKSFSNIELQEQVGINPNEPLNIEAVEKSFSKLNQFYREKAYLEFEIQNPNSSVIQYKPGQPYADVVYQIDEGRKIRVGNIKVTGLNKTHEHVILRELDFQPGEYLNISKVTNSIERLERSGLFAKVDIRTLDDDEAEGDKDPTIVIETEERKPGLFSTGIGLLNEGRLTYRGYLGAMYNNIGGKGRALSGRLDFRYQDEVNYLENRVALAYYEPFIREDRVRGRISLIREQQLFDFRPNNSDILSTNELRLSLEKEYSRQFRFTYNVWGFSNLETFNVRDMETRRNFNVGMTGPVLEFDYRDDQFLPTSGSYTRFELEYANPTIGSTLRSQRMVPSPTGEMRLDDTSEINYLRSTFSTTHYTPLTRNKRWVWVNSLRGGFLQNLSDRDGSGIPRMRSFFLGGSTTIRSFSFGVTETVPGKRELCLKQKIIDFGQSTDDCDFDDIFVRDHSTFFLVKSEIRFPIAGNLGGLIFYDGGAVFIGDINLEDPYRDALGAGIKYDTPVGAFVLQVGYKLDRKMGGLDTFYDRESEFAVHLAIGNF